MLVLLSVGNPGESNRHSVGHLVLQRLVAAFGAPQLVKRGKYSVTQLDNVLFVKSNTYMNESGALAKAFFAKRRPCDVVVICDDFEIAMPKVRLSVAKPNDSHRGVKSVAKEVPGALKLGIGIGPKPKGASREEMGDWVLAPFSQSEKAQLDDTMQTVYQYVHEMLQSEELDCAAINRLVR